MPTQHASTTGSTTTGTTPGGGRLPRTPRVGAVISVTALSLSLLLGLPAPAAAASESASNATTTQGARPIDVTIRTAEYRLDLPKRHFVAGTYTITVINSGSEPHALAVDGPTPGHVATPVLRPGESTQLTVHLREGAYDFYCPVGTHQQQGMGTTVTVS